MEYLIDEVIFLSKTNCVNCGAAKEMTDIKCPFCGTLYVDLTALDLEKGEKVACVFRMPGGGTVTALARPRLNEMSIDECPDPIYSFTPEPVYSFYPRRRTCNISIDFECVPQRDDRLFTITYGSNKGDAR